MSLNADDPRVFNIDGDDDPVAYWGLRATGFSIDLDMEEICKAKMKERGVGVLFLWNLNSKSFHMNSSLATLLDVVYELHTHQRHGRLHSPSCTALNPCVSVGHLFRPSEEINSSTAKRYDHSYLWGASSSMRLSLLLSRSMRASCSLSTLRRDWYWRFCRSNSSIFSFIMVCSATFCRIRYSSSPSTWQGRPTCDVALQKLLDYERRSIL